MDQMHSDTIISEG
ncbi:hypothetical protein CGLO_08994 [Colletotrichum gloeosporioides Cg-14]|uniref:Uncharacterized protein n=1 Tax=Colletotrichum gloeosporioides (strain Cg-14) TaxID=1237896 RepID=T0LTB7_COLGC|nr:hypothetical protein CGLO_08994 [Colletotrichum gloeosporioides Cg-14]